MRYFTHTEKLRQRIAREHIAAQEWWDYAAELTAKGLDTPAEKIAGLAQAHDDEAVFLRNRLRELVS